MDAAGAELFHVLFQHGLIEWLFDIIALALLMHREEDALDFDDQHALVVVLKHDLEVGFAAKVRVLAVPPVFLIVDRY